MQLIINGKQTEVADKLKLSELVEHLSLTDQRIAIEINEQLAPRSRFAVTRLQAGDRVEIVQAIGGG
ncbi:MAG: sulfur carrier protein ThiS [gamma proteobacterium symbiont of Bathyaustriella thionipta]|nr:sulfur carrier protein ThiS [gamma proteobacterium symbiont of Bathyaustriella thionipta]